MYADAVEQAIAAYQLKENETPTEFSQLEVEMDKSKVECETSEIYKDGTFYLANCKVNGTLVEGYTYGVEPPSFADDSWETIVANVKAGNLSAYNVGDTKQVTLTGKVTGTYTVRIANTSTPEECNTEGFSQTACGFVIEFVDIIKNHIMNSSNMYGNSVGGWPASEMRTYISDTIYNSFPLEIKENIIDTTVISSHGSAETANFTSTDKLYLLSTREVYGNEGTSNLITYETLTEKTRQLDYYKSIGVTTSSYSGAIKKYNGNATYWWLRSADSCCSFYFFRVDSDGNWVRGSGSNNTSGVAVAFRIG